MTPPVDERGWSPFSRRHRRTSDTEGFQTLPNYTFIVPSLALPCTELYSLIGLGLSPKTEEGLNLSPCLPVPYTPSTLNRRSSTVRTSVTPLLSTLPEGLGGSSRTVCPSLRTPGGFRVTISVVGVPVSDTGKGRVQDRSVFGS